MPLPASTVTEKLAAVPVVRVSETGWVWIASTVSVAAPEVAVASALSVTTQRYWA